MGRNSLQITDVTTSSEAGAHNLIKSGYLSDLGDQQIFIWEDADSKVMIKSGYLGDQQK
jgi:hypothetical protein